jgi:hypothetical protein
MASSISWVFLKPTVTASTGVLEGEAHGGLAVLGAGEGAVADQLHADDAHALATHLMDVVDDLRPAELDALYFSGRPDELRLMRSTGRMLRAWR